MSARDVIASCQRNVEKYPNDCSGFVKAVARECGVVLFGDANAIVDYLTVVGTVDRMNARTAAAMGKLVIGGVKAPGHGHVVVVVHGPVDQKHKKYPYCFWGKYHDITLFGRRVNVGFTRGHGTLNYAFDENARDQVVYAPFPVSRLLLPKARPNEGDLLNTFV